jgi:hypothetical protein
VSAMSGTGFCESRVVSVELRQSVAMNGPRDSHDLDPHAFVILLSGFLAALLVNCN